MNVSELFDGRGICKENDSDISCRPPVCSEMTEYRLEEITEKDIDRFKEIYISAFSVSDEHLKFYDFEKYLQPFIYDKDKHALMFYSGETAVGVILAIEKPSLSAEPSVYIELCAVEALYQRQGHGTAMLNMFFEKFHKNAFITLETYKSRPAYDWYQKMGFVDDDEIRYLVHNLALSLIWNDLQKLRKRNSELTEMKNMLENKAAQNSGEKLADMIENKIHEIMIS
ncbi:MAG: GNAT family N-acetyltransferase [Oscillospiraceae bacterium]|nr:GNAT family N-acetyltransferase [Oscillospiraceae bacterium]MBQ5334307.1 GNAT family N-acetyltransferase [Oscillospiraceae bacterium]